MEHDDVSMLMPTLRFPKFKHAPGWSKATIGLESDSFSGGTPETTNPSYYGGDIPFIRSAEIGKEKTEKYLTRDGLKNSAAKQIKQGDVLVALYGANSGDVALAKVDGAINQAILCLRPKGNKEFLYHLLTARKSWILATYLQGGQGNLSAEIINSLVMYFPSPAEQAVIADCLTSLDACIAAQAKKVEALKTYKRGLLQQLFPRKGETTPRLRFPGFLDSWSVGKLHDFFSLDDKPDKAPAFDPDKIITVRLHANGVVRNPRTGTLTGGANYFTRHAGQFIFSKIDLLNGAFGLVPDELEGFLSSSDIPAFSLKPETDPPYLLNWFERNYKTLAVQRTGTSPTLRRIAVESLLNLSVPIASPAEQRKIGECLTSLDTCTTAQAQILELLKTHKQGMMQQLFPQTGKSS